MNALVNNVAYALFAAGPLPMLGPGADMRRLHGFQRGKNRKNKNMVSAGR